MLKGKRKIYAVISILIFGIVVYAFLTYLEWVPPSGRWQNRSQYLGRGAILKISISDQGQGLRNVEILYKGERGSKPLSLYAADYTDKKMPLKEASFEVPLDFKKHRIMNGKGKVIINVTDRSFWNLGKGNTTRVEYNVVIDTRPPLIEILSSDHVVLQGGTEVAVYRVSSDTVKTGISVGEDFFPAYKGPLNNKDKFLAFFSYPYDLPVGKPVFVIAQDRAGNMVKKSLPILVKPKRFRKSTIRLTKRFMEEKVPEVISFANLEESGDPIKDFILVNRELRRKNEEKIIALTKNSRAKLMWKGGFLQLRNAKVESNFADFRSYTYNGRVIDREYHLGYDLAVTKRYPIGASNGGEVVFAGNLGIYGNVVVIDHGFGIFTLYGHMSTIDVKEGDMVEKGAIIGRTGETGLAGGDHLHFGIYISGRAVLPIEWWDKRWVENRIMGRIRENLK